MCCRGLWGERKHLIAFNCILLLTFIRSTRIHQQTTNFSFILPPLHISFLWHKDNNTFVHSQRLRTLLQQWEIRLCPIFFVCYFFTYFFVVLFFFSLQVNKCTTAVRIVIDPSELPMCDCSPDNDSPCGPESNCLNRMLQFECNPARCPAKEKCQNQRFQKREYADCEPLRTLHCGWGLRCKEG